MHVGLRIVTWQIPLVISVVMGSSCTVTEDQINSSKAMMRIL